MTEQSGEEQLQALSGVWHKDHEASDSPEAMADLMQLGTLLRLAMKQMKGVEIKVDGGFLEMSLLSGLLGFRLRSERWVLNGDKLTGSRRDLRSGMATAWAECLPSGGVILRSEWGDPCGGTAAEHIYLHSPDVMYKENTLTVGGETVRFKAVFRRQ